MPRGDRTGPRGYGPMTGRGMGFCAGFAGPGYGNPGWGRAFGYGRGMGYGRGAGRGWGRGLGRGWGYGPGYAGVAPIPYADVVEPWGYGAPKEAALDEEASFLKDQLAAIKDRLDEIEESRKGSKEEDEKSR